MKNVIGLEYYREYQKKNEELSKKVMELRSENDDELSLKLVHNDEERQNIVKLFFISIVLILIFIGIFTIILDVYNRMELSWIDGVVFGTWGIVFFVMFRINKVKEKKILSTNAQKSELENQVLMEYNENLEKLYGIIVYIICLNEYYGELILLKGDNLEKTWRKITSRQIEIINKTINYDISLSTYQSYFDEWLKKQEIYG